MTKLTPSQIAEIPPLRSVGHTNEEIRYIIALDINHPVPLSTLNYWIRRLRNAGTRIYKNPPKGRPALDLQTLTKGTSI